MKDALANRDMAVQHCHSPARKPGWKFYAVITLLLAGIAATSALGVWQVQRRAWKLDLINRVETRIHAAPVDAPGPDDWAGLTHASSEYSPVKIEGRFLPGQPLLAKAVTDLGSGFWVLQPFRANLGFVVLINRGFVPDAAAKQSDMSIAPGNATVLTITGLLRLSEPDGGFLRANKPDQDRWYSRDLKAMATARNLGPVAPYFIDAQEGTSAEVYPRPGLTKVTFHNSHTVYLMTWFALALLLSGYTVYLIRDAFFTIHDSTA
ncbi:SURF1 family protein [Roseibium sp. RKSG952]|uniref:SURF1 family protein n=1 Tax=Roseibium sp. RKSG952 TaxID=2529384 RepID=UPI0034CD46E4